MLNPYLPIPTDKMVLRIFLRKDKNPQEDVPGAYEALNLALQIFNDKKRANEVGTVEVEQNNWILTHGEILNWVNHKLINLSEVELVSLYEEQKFCMLQGLEKQSVTPIHKSIKLFDVESDSKFKPKLGNVRFRNSQSVTNLHLGTTLFDSLLSSFFMKPFQGMFK
jgi:hypothetical protein